MEIPNMYTVAAWMSLFLLIMVIMLALIGVLLFIYNLKINESMEENSTSCYSVMSFLNDQLGYDWMHRYRIIGYNISFNCRTPYTKIKFDQTMEWFNLCYDIKVFDCDSKTLSVELSEMLKYGTELHINLIHSVLYDIIHNNSTYEEK